MKLSKSNLNVNKYSNDPTECGWRRNGDGGLTAIAILADSFIISNSNNLLNVSREAEAEMEMEEMMEEVSNYMDPIADVMEARSLEVETNRR